MKVSTQTPDDGGDSNACTPPPVPQGSTYTSCYCEENIYLLVEQLCAQADQPAARWAELWDVYVVFVSNDQKTVRIQLPPLCTSDPVLFATGPELTSFHRRSHYGIRKRGMMSWCGITMSYWSSVPNLLAAALRAAGNRRQNGLPWKPACTTMTVGYPCLATGKART